MVSNFSSVTEVEIKDLMFSTWPPTFESLYNYIETQETNFIQQLALLQRATLPNTRPEILRKR